jgi:ribosomal protein S18 acetylase RimI-like enzyme
MKANQALLRRASVADAEQILALKRLVFGDTSLLYTIYQAEQSLSYLKAIIPSDRFRVAEFPSKIVGYYHAIERDHALFLNYIGTDPKYRGNCIGTRLLHDVHQVAQNASLDVIELDVSASNAGALHWYEQNGFKVLQETHLYRILTAQVSRAAAPPTVSRSELIRALKKERQQGFSKVACLYKNRRLVLGLIAGHTCKLLKGDGVPQLDTAGAISTLFPRRKFLVISLAQPLNPSVLFVSHERSLRMRKVLR